jgi:hypothetical protein
MIMWKRDQIIERGGRKFLADVYTPTYGAGGCGEVRIKGPAPAQTPKKQAPIAKHVPLPEGTPTLDQIHAGMTVEEYARIAKHAASVLNDE